MKESTIKDQPKQWSGKSRGGSFGYSFFVFLIRVLGVRAAYVFLSLVALYFVPFAPKATAVIWRYNRRILGYGVAKSIFKLYQHYYTFGQTIIDKLAIVNGMSGRFKFEFDNYEEFQTLVDRGVVVMIGGHVGCWEAGAEFFGDYAQRLNVVMFDGEYDRIKDKVDTSKFGYKIIPINGGGIESLLRIKQAVDANECICFQGDRYAEGMNHCKVKFMGFDALFPVGPTLVASKFKTPVIFYFAMREKGRRYRFIFKTIEGGMSQQEILSSYLGVFEEVVKNYPQQWFNFFDLWQYE